MTDELITEQGLLNETTRVSFHRRDAVAMALSHKSSLEKAGHKVLSHETKDDGSHVIHHLTPRKRVRTTTITANNSGKRKDIKAKLVNKPASQEDVQKFGPKPKG